MMAPNKPYLLIFIPCGVLSNMGPSGSVWSLQDSTSDDMSLIWLGQNKTYDCCLGAGSSLSITCTGGSMREEPRPPDHSWWEADAWWQQFKSGSLSPVKPSDETAAPGDSLITASSESPSQSPPGWATPEFLSSETVSLGVICMQP